jgi:hypothetical protein
MLRSALLMFQSDLSNARTTGINSYERSAVAAQFALSLVKRITTVGQATGIHRCCYLCCIWSCYYCSVLLLAVGIVESLAYPPLYKTVGLYILTNI